MATALARVEKERSPKDTLEEWKMKLKGRQADPVEHRKKQKEKN